MRSVVKEKIKNELIRSTSLTDYDIITFTETWLKPSHHNNEFISDKYRIFRKDRSESNIEAERGGGVLIAVKDNIDCDVHSIPEMSELESICVKFPLKRGNLLIYCLYIQPDASIDTYKQHVLAIKKLQITDHDSIVIAGDFNLPLIKWVQNDDSFDFVPIIGESESRDALISKFVTKEMLEAGFFQMNYVKNASGNVLDLVYTNIPELTVVELTSKRLIPSGLSDKAHNPLHISIECEPTVMPSNDSLNLHYCFRKANFDHIREHLQTIDFDALCITDDIDEILRNFYSILYETFDKFVPKASLRSNKNPPWFTKELINLKNKRNRIYKKLCDRKKDNPNADDSQFITANENFSLRHKEVHEEYIKQLAEDFKQKPKNFWNFVNGHRKSNNLPCKMSYDNKSATTDEEKANLFAEFFSSVYKECRKDETLSNTINSRNDHNCRNVLISKEAIFHILGTMDLNKGQGPDKIPPIFLRECNGVLAEPLANFFNKSLQTGQYPTAFKTSSITPIFKSGSKADIGNYRGVSIMPNLAKVFEKSVHYQLRMIICPQLSKQQHGFLSNRCIETNLMEFVNFTHAAFDKDCQVHTFYADIKKAFDTIDHTFLIEKLAKFRIGNQTLRWLSSYSWGRKQFVRVGSSVSNTFNAYSAVAQGTILGPLLFLAFFNDSDVSNECEDVGIFNFADDKKIAKSVRTMNDTDTLQRTIDNFVTWCDNNGLELNVAKCKIMTFSWKRANIDRVYTIKGEPIKNTDEMRDLGVMMDPKLTFRSHIEHIKKKADSVLAFVKRECYKTFDTNVAKLLYGALVRSHLEFANVIWSPYQVTYKNIVESTQKDAVIYLRGDNRNRAENGYVLTPYIERSKDLDLTTLVRRRVDASIFFIKKIISGQMDCPYLRNQLNLNTGLRTLRNPEFIRLGFSKRDHVLNSPFNYACRAFNHAALFVDPTLPFHEFKKRVLKLPDCCFGELAKL